MARQRCLEWSPLQTDLVRRSSEGAQETLEWVIFLPLSYDEKPKLSIKPSASTVVLQTHILAMKWR
jgi:hypothetical protein